jgi:Spy/CpxP family protein refolding chaperone
MKEGGTEMKKRLIAIVALAALALAAVTPALASQPDSNPPGHQQQGGQEGYEGHPGNQSSGGN